MHIADFNVKRHYLHLKFKVFIKHERPMAQYCFWTTAYMKWSLGYYNYRANIIKITLDRY